MHGSELTSGFMQCRSPGQRVAQAGMDHPFSCERGSAVERRLPKPRVEGSNPFVRSMQA